MKRIAIFCDGTWLRNDSEHPSNVWRLAQAIVAKAPDGVSQQGFYFPGVGVGRGSDELTKQFDKWTGGAFGWGLDLNIETAYRKLMEVYEPNDEVYVFGFSRGAYTARSLVGLIRRAGLMSPKHADRVSEAMDLYRRRITDDPGRDEKGRKRSVPDRPEFLKWRATYAPLSPTSAYEIDWRAENGLFVPDRLVQLAYLGVWDTVGALGVPGYFTTAPLFNRRYNFHDTDLSSMVRRARHAVAVDERRLSFAPTLWTNLAELNRKSPDLRTRGLSADADLSGALADQLPYQQAWFPGDHGAVGGGNATLGLSSYALAWIAAGAAKAGLALDPPFMSEVSRSRNIRDPLLTRGTAGFGRLWQLADRDGPDDPTVVSEAARERIATFADYDPPTLSKVMQAFRAPKGLRPAPPSA